MRFFSIRFKIIFQKSRYNAEISFSSIAEKGNKHYLALLSSPVNLPAIFGRSKMGNLLELLEEICSYFMISAIYPIIESSISNGLVSSTSKVCPSPKIHLSIVPEYFNVQIIYSLCMIAKDLWLATFG